MASVPTDDPSQPGAADGTAFVVAVPAEFVAVPALDRWALLLLALGLLALGWRQRALR